MSQEHGQQFLLDLPGIEHRLPYSPALLSRLFGLTGPESDTPIEEIAETLGQDQSLTAKVLTLANSAFYGLQQEVTTVSRAVAVLGLNEVRAMVLAIGVKALARDKALPKAFDLKAYWSHQLSVALVGRRLAPLMGGVDADDLFTAGVLHDLGKLLTALHRPEDWQVIEDLTASRTLPYSEAEDEHWGLDHGVIGSMVLSGWNLPEALTEPINWHHAPLRAPSHKRQALVLCVGDALTHAVQDAEEISRCPWREVLAKFGLDADRLLGEIRTLLAEHDPDDLAAGLAS